MRAGGARTSGSCGRSRGAIPKRQLGLSYVEVLVATVLLALALVPALEALQIGVLAGSVHESEATLHAHLVAKLEEVLAEPFVDLELEALAAAGNPTSYSDSTGSSDRRLVFLAGYDGDDADGDGDPFTGPDPGLVWVRVEIEGTAHALETLATW